MAIVKKRDYEVSIWTLQDEFLTLLKPANIESKGQPRDGNITLKSDGTQELQLSIPKFIFSNGLRIVNPIWENTINGVIVKNLRKIKLIFNKMTEDEAVFEFVIIDTVERHENDEVFCDIKCEGLAFQELGKKGYKISLTSDNFYLDDYNAFIAGEEQPTATLQYWNKQFLSELPQDGILDPTIWYFDIQMDWSSYGGSRDSKKVYEEEYVSSWEINNGKLIPKSIEAAIEKARLVDINESNIYNITQTLAETFGVFCRYEYGYDRNYHIISRKVIYYNNFNIERLGYLDLTYPYTTSKITREYDGKDITTKMFVKPIDSEATNSGVLTILDVPANKSQEDYILNFDYMYSIGAINKEQYDEIEKYETQLAELNTNIKNTDNQLIVYETELPDVQGRLTLANNSAQLDRERIAAADDLLNKLDAKDGELDGSIPITEGNPDTAIMLENHQDAVNNSYYISLPRQGIQAETIHIYRDIDYSKSVGNGRLTNEITSGQIGYDEFGIPNRVLNLYPSGQGKKQVYLIYKYTPRLYTESVKRTWETRLAKDMADIDSLAAKETFLTNIISLLNTTKANLLAEKEAAISAFNKMMGPALRESYWQPENYKDVGDHFIDNFILSTDANSIVKGASNYTELFWDDELFDGEQDITYQLGVEQAAISYPCIRLDSYMDYIKAHVDEVSFLFYDYIESSTNPYEPRNIKAFSVGSEAQYGFIKENNTIIPVLILTGASKLSQTSLENLHSLEHKPQLGVLTSTVVTDEYNNPSIITTIEDSEELSTDKFILNATQIFYPRIKINSLALKNNDEDLTILYGNDLNLLKNYEDYNILAREQAFYISIKPEVLYRFGLNNEAIDLRFALSNADTAIYLDSLQVLKENSVPRVSYELTPNVFDDNFMFSAYKQLNRIVNINDSDLQLKNAQGYISELTLDLDEPQNDKVIIKNYKNKFEDLFSSIVAQTESMKSSSYTIEKAAEVINSDGTLSGEVIQNTLQKVNLYYAFNNGKLTINERDGIWGISDDGVVAFRGGGIFTATDKDKAGNWIWNTGIVPQGINANLITAGQLDTEKILIYGGDKVRFQLNGEGLFAYKSILDDSNILEAARNIVAINEALQQRENDLDTAQYVVHDKNGLFLVAKKGALILNQDHNALNELDEDINRVEISWDGLILRDWENNRTFYADADTGDLTLKGTVYATGLYIGNNDEPIDTHINNTINTTLDDLGVLDSGRIYYQAAEPTDYHQRDLWINTNDNNQYIAICNYDDTPLPATRWILINKKIQGAQLSVDTENGKISIAAGESIDISGGNLNLVGNSGITVGSGGNINVASGGKFTITSDNFKIDNNGAVEITGALRATSLTIQDEGFEDFNALVEVTDVGAYVQSKEQVLNTMEFTASEGLRIRAGESPYSTLTTNNGYYVQYNNNNVASFTGDGIAVDNLSMGNIVVKKTGRGGWRWSKKER